MQFVPRFMLPSVAPTLAPHTRLGAYAILGQVAGTREGILYECTGGRAIGPPAAQFAISGLAEAIDGLWVHKSGRSIWTRVKVPKGYKELALSDGAFTGSYRVAISSPRYEEAALRLLDPDFTRWYLEHGPQGGALSQAGSFEVSAGALFVLGAPTSYGTAEQRHAFAIAAAELATRVATFVGPTSPRASSPLGQ